MGMGHYIQEVGTMSNSLIYEPKGRAREYAPLALNTYTGCDHGCLYCYASLATHKTRTDFAASHVRDGFIARLAKEAALMQREGLTGQVLLSFTTDPYQNLDAREAIARGAITILHEAGFSVCVLSKGGVRALRDLDLFTPADTYAATLTFLDDARSMEWEPRAALPKDRIETLETFHSRGIPTWVSLEPVLDPEATLDIILDTAPFVDMYKVGKLNYHPLSKEIDWSVFARRAAALLNELGYRRIEDPIKAVAKLGERKYYIKRDLAQFL
jgi:DNA repair photolyase